MHRIERRLERCLTVAAPPVELSDNGLQPIERQVGANESQRFGESVVPVTVGELMLEGGLGNLLDGLARDRQLPS